MNALLNDAIQPLLERQRALEDEAMSEGAARFRRRLSESARQGRGTQMGAARKLLQEAIDPLALMLESFVKDGKGRKCRPHQSAKWIERVGYDTLAYMAVKVALDGVTRTESRAKFTARIFTLRLAELVGDELRYRRFRDDAPELFDYKIDHFKTSNYSHMRKSMDASMRFAEIDCADLKMAPNVEALFGLKVLDLLLDATGLLAIETVSTRAHGARGGHKTETLLVATPATTHWIDTRNDALEFLWPVNMPMVVPPIAWSPEQRGGYRFALRDKYALVRSPSKEHAAAIASATMPVVYDAVNHIQETAWRINPDVYALLQDIIARGGDMAGVPQLAQEDLPPKPKDIAGNPVARKAWRKLAHGVKQRNHDRKIKAAEFTKTLNMAKAMKDDAAIFFPMNLDFRGRVYPICSFLSPQGDDLSKSLLTFSAGKPLGVDGAGWLALHGANCLGETPDGIKLSRCTLEERVSWIVSHTALLERVATAPFDDRWWADTERVDDPLQFYAFCCAWTRYTQAVRVGQGAAWLCALPCAMDGTCNGLQHFAAMLRDPVGGAAVNVVPLERPQDIYQSINDAIVPTLEREASDNRMAALWLTSGLLGRKLAKRPTMTFGYGSKEYGFKQQLVEYLNGLENAKAIREHFSETVDGKAKSLLPHACSYMASHIWNTLQVTVVAAAQGMQWMQDAARCVARNGRCVEWVVPGTGFPVRQAYMQFTRKRVETVLAGKMYKSSIYADTDIPDRAKQASAVAPNFVHSLDAAALMLTVEQAAQQGVSSFGMIHDSYATHAGDCEVLSQCTRQAFYGLYQEHDVIESFSAQLRWQWVETENVKLLVSERSKAPFPATPQRGTLDLSGVLQSLYFFS